VEKLQEIYKYRELIWALALKELRIRYKRSSLGFLWALLNPLLMMLILTAVFSTVMRIPVAALCGVSDQRVASLDILFPGTHVLRRVDRRERRAAQKGVGAKIRFSDRGSAFECNQFRSFYAAAGPGPRKFCGSHFIRPGCSCRYRSPLW